MMVTMSTTSGTSLACPRSASRIGGGGGESAIVISQQHEPAIRGAVSTGARSVACFFGQQHASRTCPSIRHAYAAQAERRPISIASGNTAATSTVRRSRVGTPDYTRVPPACIPPLPASVPGADALARPVTRSHSVRPTAPRFRSSDTADDYPKLVALLRDRWLATATAYLRDCRRAIPISIGQIAGSPRSCREPPRCGNATSRESSGHERTCSLAPTRHRSRATISPG